MEVPVFNDVQEETDALDPSSTELVAEVAHSPSMCVKCKIKFTEKRKTVKCDLETPAFNMTRLAREKAPQGKAGDTVKVRVLHIHVERCNSTNILGVIMDVDLTKDL